MPSPDDSLPALFEALTGRYGRPEPPWGTGAGGRDPFEGLVAELLARALDARKCDRALAALRDAGLLDPQTLAEADPAETADALRSAGLRVADKALAPVRRVARWLVELHHGAADELAGPEGDVATSRLREELTALNGIGPATADALLLFTLRRPVYPMDRATYRVFVRHGWIDPTADYEEARAAVERLAPDDPAALARLSAWFERVARDFCRVSAPKCERCPLRPFLPEGGPIDPGG
jgi:endonuclease-3 related protein